MVLQSSAAPAWIEERLSTDPPLMEEKHQLEDIAEADEMLSLARQALKDDDSRVDCGVYERFRKLVSEAT